MTMSWAWCELVNWCLVLIAPKLNIKRYASCLRTREGCEDPNMYNLHNLEYGWISCLKNITWEPQSRYSLMAYSLPKQVLIPGQWNPSKLILSLENQQSVDWSSQCNRFTHAPCFSDHSLHLSLKQIYRPPLLFTCHASSIYKYPQNTPLMALLLQKHTKDRCLQRIRASTLINPLT